MEATEEIGMGSWRLKGAMDPPWEGLTAHIEGLWRHKIEDLGLFPLDYVSVESAHAALIMTSHHDMQATSHIMQTQ